MATRTRLLLSSTGGPFGSKSAVYDVISQQHAQRRFSSAKMCSSKIACAALTTAKDAAQDLCVSQELLDVMHAALKSSAPRTRSADVELPELGLVLQNVVARGALREGKASFLVEKQTLPSTVRAVHAKVTAGDQELELMALVKPLSNVQKEAVTGVHLVGKSADTLVDLCTLGLNRKHPAAMPSHSYYQQRLAQLTAHKGAMMNFGVSLKENKHVHSPLFDAYVSQTEHAGEPLLCVSVFA